MQRAGIDRIIFSQERLPKRGERAPLLLKARDPVEGSYSVPQLIQEASNLLGIGVPFLNAIGAEIVGQYVAAVLDCFKGKVDAVQLAIGKMAGMHHVAVQAMVNMQGNAMATIDRMDERRHSEAMGLQDVLRASIQSSGAAVVDYGAPVGRSVDQVSSVWIGPDATV